MTLSEERTRGIFWGGLVGGLASAIPLIGWLNCFCCLWGWIAGAVAIAVVIRAGAFQERETAATGALAGAFAGLISSTIESVWGLLMGPAMAGFLERIERYLPDDVPPGTLDMLQSLPEQGLALVAMKLISTIFSMAVFAGFGALGALLYLRLTRPPGAPPSGDTPPAAGNPVLPDGSAEPE
jgi:hypothetical protein